MNNYVYANPNTIPNNFGTNLSGVYTNNPHTPNMNVTMTSTKKSNTNSTRKKNKKLTVCCATFIFILFYISSLFIAFRIMDVDLQIKKDLIVPILIAASVLIFGTAFLFISICRCKITKSDNDDNDNNDNEKNHVRTFVSNQYPIYPQNYSPVILESQYPINSGPVVNTNGISTNQTYYVPISYSNPYENQN